MSHTDQWKGPCGEGFSVVMPDIKISDNVVQNGNTEKRIFVHLIDESSYAVGKHVLSSQRVNTVSESVYFDDDHDSLSLTPFQN